MGRQDPQWVRRVVSISRWYIGATVAGYLVGFRLLMRHAPAPWPSVLGLTVAAFAVAGVARFRRYRVERVLSQPVAMRCPNCGYNLKFNKGHCPECGRPCIVSTGKFADTVPAVPEEADE